MRVEVALVDPRGAHCQTLELEANATVADAVAASRFRGERPAAVAVYGKVVRMDRSLRDGDRIDLLSHLVVDPKEARRRRAVASTSHDPVSRRGRD